jgi:predicted ArsR family transcriptional regulator
MSPSGAYKAIMLNVLGSSQRSLLHTLQRHKDGRTIEEIAQDLELSATAVRQHLASLERHGYVKRVEPRKTAGRPGFVYALSPAGSELFPRRYSWFTSLILESMAREQGSERLGEYLRGMAARLAESMTRELGQATPEVRLAALADALNQFGYDADVFEDGSGSAEVRAFNCVYHHLAQDHPQVCEFDLELMARVSGRRVDHVECMVRGGQCCRFRLTGTTDSQSRTAS